MLFSFMLIVEMSLYTIGFRSLVRGALKKSVGIIYHVDAFIENVKYCPVDDATLKW